MGIPISALDENGKEVFRRIVSPWGEVLHEEGDIQIPFVLPGQYRDWETGLHYNFARYYSPKDKRYISPDLVRAVNLYQYAGNNPVKYIDPTGLFEIEFFSLGPEIPLIRYVRNTLLGLIDFVIGRLNWLMTTRIRVGICFIYCRRVRLSQIVEGAAKFWGNINEVLRRVGEYIGKLVPEKVREFFEDLLKRGKSLLLDIVIEVATPLIREALVLALPNNPGYRTYVDQNQLKSLLKEIKDYYIWNEGRKRGKRSFSILWCLQDIGRCKRWFEELKEEIAEVSLRFQIGSPIHEKLTCVATSLKGEYIRNDFTFSLFSRFCESAYYSLVSQKQISTFTQKGNPKSTLGNLVEAVRDADRTGGGCGLTCSPYYPTLHCDRGVESKQYVKNCLNFGGQISFRRASCHGWRRPLGL